MANSVSVPKPGEWPGVIEAFKTVKPIVKEKIWDFVSVIGIGIIVSLIVSVILTAVFKTSVTGLLIRYIVYIAIGAFLQAVVVSMYFDVLRGEEFTLNSALNYGMSKMLKMAGLIIVMYVIFVVSFVLFIIPFFIVLPRVYLAPYFLIKDDSTVSDALSKSWNLTRGNAKWVWGIILLNIAIGLLFITIIGIPFAIYWGIINSACYALMTMYLSQSQPAQAKTTQPQTQPSV